MPPPDAGPKLATAARFIARAGRQARPRSANSPCLKGASELGVAFLPAEAQSVVEHLAVPCDLPGAEFQASRTEPPSSQQLLGPRRARKKRQARRLPSNKGNLQIVPELGGRLGLDIWFRSRAWVRLWPRTVCSPLRHVRQVGAFHHANADVRPPREVG